jgi:glycosyltransferase involved in cell wall biosynthesis
MRIAQIAPLYESVPPHFYGGTERIVSIVTEALVRRGHEVTLFASGDSSTRARLVPAVPCALRLDSAVVDPLAHHVVQLRHVIDRAASFDIIHNHMDYLGFPLLAATSTAVITTLHGRLDLADLRAVFAAYSDAALISISDAQRQPFAGADWRGTVYHGLPVTSDAIGHGDGGYLAFLGRISPEKRVDSAIRVATAVGMPIKIAAKVDRADAEYFEERIRPLLKTANVEFLGEIGGADKVRFLGAARALLFPIDWPEPFGLVMIEALACGTPVIARRRGSVPEVLEDGVTGFVCDDDDAMIDAARRIDELDRATCRRVFESRFSDTRMVDDYERIYAETIGRLTARSA